MAAKKTIKEVACHFESGYITKSPCRDCSLKRHLPGCSDNCRTLSQLQELLVGIVSCSNNFPEHETYCLARKSSGREM